MVLRLYRTRGKTSEIKSPGSRNDWGMVKTVWRVSRKAGRASGSNTIQYDERFGP